MPYPATRLLPPSFEQAFFSPTTRSSPDILRDMLRSSRVLFISPSQIGLPPRARNFIPCHSAPIAQYVTTATCTSSSPLTRRNFLRLISALPTLPAVSRAAEYDRYAPTYDALDGSTTLTKALGFDKLRVDLLSRAKGAVLEMGAGTGVNFPLYDRTALSSFTALDASPEMLRRADTLAAQLYPPLSPHFVIGDAAHTGLSPESFDTVVATFALCVIPHPEKVMYEMRRLVKPNGSVLILDYTLSDNVVLAAYQKGSAPAVSRLSKGCRPDLDLRTIAQDAGFSISWKQYVLNGTVVALQLTPS